MDAVTNVWLMAVGDVHKLVLVALFWLVQQWVSGTPGRVWAQEPWWPLGLDLQCPPFSLLRGSALVRRTLPARVPPWPSRKCSKRIHDSAAATASLSGLPFTLSLLGWLIYEGQLTMSSFCLWICCAAGPALFVFRLFPWRRLLSFSLFFLNCIHVAQPEWLLIRNTANVQWKTALRGCEDGDQERDGESNEDQESSRGSTVSNNVSHVRITIFS